ncbi:MAG: hypothetical protein AAGI37_13965 [Planctomycetota bacterium]
MKYLLYMTAISLLFTLGCQPEMIHYVNRGETDANIQVDDLCSVMASVVEITDYERSRNTNEPIHPSQYYRYWVDVRVTQSFCPSIKPGKKFRLIFGPYELGDKKLEHGEELILYFTENGKFHSFDMYTDNGA